MAYDLEQAQCIPNQWTSMCQTTVPRCFALLIQGWDSPWSSFPLNLNLERLPGLYAWLGYLLGSKTLPLSNQSLVSNILYFFSLTIICVFPFLTLIFLPGSYQFHKSFWKTIFVAPLYRVFVFYFIFCLFVSIFIVLLLCVNFAVLFLNSCNGY